MKLAICDDESRDRSWLALLVREYAQIHPQYDMTLTLFDYPDDCLEAAMKNGGFDLYLLDIVMPYTNGISLAERLIRAKVNGLFLFVTSSKEYALDAYRVRPFHYLIKPVDKEQLFSVLDDVMQALDRQQSRFMLIKTKEQSLKLSFEQILWVELASRTAVYHLTDGESIQTLVLRTTFNEAIKDLLHDPAFLQFGTSTAVNLQHISSIEKDSITFQNGQRLFLPKKYTKDVRGAWMEYWMNRNPV